MSDQQNNGYYFSEFKELVSIGFGAFGSVFKAIMKSDQVLYAVKKVALKESQRKQIFTEVNFLKELKGVEGVVGYFGNWFESNYYLQDYNQSQCNELLVQIPYNNVLFKKELQEILHIQLQLCKMSLKDVIDKLNDYNYENPCVSYSINEFIYKVAIEIFAQLVKGLNHFHNNFIIHRDLTPANILISDGNLVKISDLGLAAKHEDENVYDYKIKYGSHIYKPKEFFIGYYEPGSDLYSIGVIAEQLFCIYPLTNEFVENVRGDQREVCELIQKLTSDRIRKRGSCDDTLKKIEELKLKSNSKDELEIFFNSFKTITNN